jgi:DNA repair protein RadA/Sms
MMFICSICQYATTTKLWKCPDCNSFGSFDEVQGGGGEKKQKKNIHPLKKNDAVGGRDPVFYAFKEEAYHRVFSHWIKKWWIYLLGGEPGIWKSTLVLQIIANIQAGSVWYFSWEEQVSEIMMRAKRVLWDMPSDVSVYYTTSLEEITATVHDNNFSMIIVDSIQTISTHHTDGIAGSPSQVKACSDELATLCRHKGIWLLCLGHVTKGWEIAGPKYLEHIVDVVVYVDWDRFGEYRTLRTTKNRFGSTDDAVVFAMTEKGLKVVGNDFRIHTDKQWHIGRVLTVWLENWRPILVHVEALLTKNYNNHPQRNAVWIDPKRLQLIIAILEKYCKCSLYQFDIFVNIPWEFTFYDSGIDVAIAAAIYSQYKGIIPEYNLVYMGEIWLSGQIMKARLYEKRANIVDGSLVLIDGVGRKISDVLG